MKLRNYTSETSFLGEVESFAHSYVASHAQLIDAHEKLPNDINDQLSERRLFAFDKLCDSDPFLPLTKRYELLTTIIEVLARVSASVAKVVLDQNLGQVSMFREFVSKELE